MLLVEDETTAGVRAMREVAVLEEANRTWPSARLSGGRASSCPERRLQDIRD